MRHQASKNSPPGPADWRTLKKLGPYLWDHRWRFIFAVSFLIGAKVATIGVPIVLKHIVDSLDTAKNAVLILPAALIVGYGLLRLATTLFTDLRDMIFAKVTQGMIRKISIEAFRVAHSLRALAVGYRIAAGRKSFFYVPDIAALLEPEEALSGVALYIGDGATLKRSMVRRRGRDLIGHATVGDQLAWCREQGVGRAIFTHCGSGIVRSESRAVAALIAKLGQEHGVDASVAHDGQRLAFS